MLPLIIVSVGPTLERLNEFRRADPNGELLGETAERDYDRVFATCLDVIESLLRESGDIASDSRLKLLSEPGKQVAHLDLLLAEIGPGTDQDFRRLIVVEDKLSTNAQCRRDVLAQILEYSHIVQTILTPDDLPDNVTDWVEEYRYEIHQAMRAGNFLLIICGDEIHESLVRLVHSYVQRIDPSNLSDLVLMALPIYSDGHSHILVPHIVAGTERAARDLTLRVEVHAADGRPVTIQRITASNTPGGAARRRRNARLVEPEAFMTEWEKTCGLEAANGWRDFVVSLQNALIPGLRVGHYAAGAPYICLENTTAGTVQVLRLSDTSPEVRDRLGGEIWDSRPEFQEIRNTFRRAVLQKVPGAAIRGMANRVYAPVKALADNKEAVIGSISQLSAQLATVSPGPDTSSV
jgi:hypothetical protein